MPLYHEPMKNPHKLPCCGIVVDTMGHIGNKPAQAKPGDLGICLECGTWLRFKDDLTQRLFNIEDFMEIPDVELNQLRRATAALKAARRS